MGKIAFVFSGQGDQYPGMGREVYEKYLAAQEVFRVCDGLRPGTSASCFEGSEEELKETKTTQPCLFAMELAAAAVLTGLGVRADAAAGFSLGEVAAAAFCGIYGLEDGFRLVCRRGELMQAAAGKADTSMAAVVKLSVEKVEELCGAYSDIYPVNFNCPGQITVSGLSSQMKDFAAAVKKAGGRAIPLKVKAAFHSPFMQEAAVAFGTEVGGVGANESRIPLYSNLTASPYTADAAELLAKQIVNPVRWEESIRHMIADGVTTFVEIGPGRTLTNMIAKTDAGVTAKTVFEYLEELEGGNKDAER